MLEQVCFYQETLKVETVLKKALSRKEKRPWDKPNMVGGLEGLVPPMGFGAKPQIAKKRSGYKTKRKKISHYDFVFLNF